MLKQSFENRIVTWMTTTFFKQML